MGDFEGLEGLATFEALRVGLTAFFTDCLVDFLAMLSSGCCTADGGSDPGEQGSGLKKLGRGALDDTPGRRGLCLIHRVRPE
jgi:hypothetical protein